MASFAFRIALLLGSALLLGFFFSESQLVILIA